MARRHPEQDLHPQAIKRHTERRRDGRHVRRADIDEAFLAIGCSLIWLKLLQGGESLG